MRGDIASPALVVVVGGILAVVCDRSPGFRAHPAEARSKRILSARKDRDCPRLSKIRKNLDGTSGDAMCFEIRARFISG